ncbi:ABC transporter substrate-binding protein [Rhizobium rhizogenes]|uniref:ABC transporter substrate-binding protein n=1 Tax=Rhizobium rhizogenes TaxID=359 RepID=UPI001572BFF3|nr:ABC transporter substrate-binding protein [Rhizobium rhizogenes]NTF97909.1 solute-binding protein [Rhizobium rhizogenes]
MTDQSDLITVARIEGQVVWYTGLLYDEVAQPMCQAFERQYTGVRAICDRSWPVDAVGKVIDERARGEARCDVFDGVGSPALANAEGLDQPCDLPEFAAIPPEHRDPSGRWTAQILYHATHAWNADIVPPEDAPRTLEALLDPRWKGRICWCRETLSGRPGFVALVLLHFGEQEGVAYLHRLARQEIAPLGGLGRDTMRALGRGEYAVALQIFAHHAMIEREGGGNIGWPVKSPVLTFPNPISVCRTASHPAAARLFVNFVLSAEGQEIMRQGRHIPSRLDVPALDRDLAKIHGYFLTPYAISRCLPKWERIGREIFPEHLMRQRIK